MCEAAATAAPKYKYLIPTGEADITRSAALDAICREHSDEVIEEHVPNQEGVMVLNVGCGGGLPMLRSARIKPGSHWTGIDFEKKQIALAKQHLDATPDLKGRVTFAEGDVYALDQVEAIAGKQFDVVYCRFVLSNLSDPGKAVESILPFVKPGGLFICIEAGQMSDGSRGMPRDVSDQPGEGTWTETTRKAFTAVKTMLDIQHAIQKSHLDRTAEIVVDALDGRVAQFEFAAKGLPVETQEKKALFRLVAEAGLSRLETDPNIMAGLNAYAKAKGMDPFASKEDFIERIFGYKDGNQWVEDFRAFEEDPDQQAVYDGINRVIAMK